MACSPAQAQNSAAIIEQRIDAVFNIVPQNVADLAIPLTRRALARRSAKGDDRSSLLAYQAVEPQARAEPEAVRPAERVTATVDQDEAVLELKASSAEGDLEQGSAEEDPGAEVDGIRIPRPRPLASEQGDAGEAVGSLAADEPKSPLDLVAGAALPETANSEPESGPLVPPPALGQPAYAMRQTTAESTPVVEDRPSAQESEPIVTAALRGRPVAAASAVPETDSASAPRPTRTDCLAADKLADADKDFVRNAAKLTAPGFCLAEEKFKERRRPWTVQTVDSGRPGPIWAVMHDDEDVAFDSAVQGLTDYGGVLITVDTGGKRNQDGIDPNRNFSDDAISCPKLGKAAAPQFTAAFKKLLDPARPIIALHNNFHGPVPTTGIGHLSMTTVPKKMRIAKSNDPDGPLASERALVLLAAAEPVEPAVDATMETLSGKGVNVVLETVKGKSGDCSLSNYAVLSGHKSYFNVTVDHDEGEKQRRIIEAILAESPKVASSD